MIPTGMGLLTQLHKLHLSTGNDRQAIYDVANLFWISVVTPLADLSMSFRKCVEDMMQDINLLTNLTRLAVMGLGGRPVVNIDMEWHKLQALQELSICICNCRMQLGSGIGGLLNLDKLQQISFQGSHVASDMIHCDTSYMSYFGLTILLDCVHKLS
ncbi:TPA: hypothetical protein ACH3X1_008390 [Trebouxia sp. C0004]